MSNQPMGKQKRESHQLLYDYFCYYCRLTNKKKNEIDRDKNR